MFKVSPASLQTFIDTLNNVLEDCVQYRRSTFRIYSVMAIFISSIVWGLFEYTDPGAQRLFNHTVYGDACVYLNVCNASTVQSKMIIISTTRFNISVL